MNLLPTIINELFLNKDGSCPTSLLETLQNKYNYILIVLDEQT